ncbi:flagellar basal body rod protein FlgC [bacterium]|nr:MAG: flagellar basal body rod protein FlgC [bacterium]
MDAQRVALDVAAENIASADAWTARGVYRRKVVTLSAGGGFDGLVRARVRETNDPVRWHYDPGDPRAQRVGSHRGYVALSPVDTVEQMVALLSAERGYEADAAVLDAVKSGITHALEVERP